MSGTFELRTLWGWRKSSDGPELLEAWDEISVSDFEEGWRDACKDAIASIGDELYSHRYITLRVPDAAIFAAFLPPDVDAEVVP